MSYSMMQKVNNFALRAFRDTADRDYIHARMAYRVELFPQFHRPLHRVCMLVM